MRRVFRDALMTAVALSIILMVLVSFDSRVREQVELRLSSPWSMASDAGHGVNTLASAISDALRERSLDRAPLLIFVFGAGLLLLFLLRT